MTESITARADRLFDTACALSRADAKAIHGDHAARGLLRSGSTIKRVTQAFADRSYAALDEALASVAARVDHRGRKWRSMLAEIDAAIDRHMDRAPDIVGEFIRVAGTNGERLAAPILADIRSSLHSRLADYREGWTAPPGKPWRERNTVPYAILLMLAGAVIGEGVKLAFSSSAEPEQGAQVVAPKLPSPAP